MIDDLTIFSRSGLILWRKSFVKLRGDPLSRLVQTVLLADRAALPELVCDGYTVRWQLANDVGLVFALVYQTALPPAYATDLLASVRLDFTRRYADLIADGAADDFSPFAPHFERLLTAAEDKSLSRAAAARSARPAAAPAVSGPCALAPSVSEVSSASSVSADTVVGHTVAAESSAVELDPEEVMRRNREAFMKRRKGHGKKAGGAAAAAAVAANSDVATSAKKPKQKRDSSKVTAEDVAALDFSSDKPSVADASEAELARFREQFLEAPANSEYNVMEDAGAGGDDDALDGGAGGGVFDFFVGLAGMKDLKRADMEPALEQFREALIGKNVAKDIADKLMESVASSLVGKRMESMTTVAATVRKALDEALTRILTPRQSVDILAEISAKRGSGRPFVISFCGVNGVGKSTSLAKICFYLINNGYRVMIAACDTFRAGAVEQLRTHVRCLGSKVELFDRGYGKDAAAVAMDAVRRAKELRYDVVLIDTAGRMQDNEPLMRALAKLVEVNQPDRLFFVGEALVGNDAVDQLTKFNSSLADFQKSTSPRLIDGIVLTKFDTIDDKVGAAVSMVYATGQPIVFVGVGQTYMDLRKVNTRSLVKALLK
jgi:signal recognition particle receptor subunit alpha